MKAGAHTHARTHTDTRSHTHTHTLSLSLSLTHTHTHTHNDQSTITPYSINACHKQGGAQFLTASPPLQARAALTRPRARTSVPVSHNRTSDMLHIVR